MRKVIFWLYNALLIIVPLVFYPWNSEVFEFNKIIVVYLITILITAAWFGRMIQERKIIFRRTILDIPLIVFLASQIFSAIFSLDFHTSLLGYYSRFNGGLFSLFAYALLYWAYVANIRQIETKRILNNALLTLTFVCLWAILEHFSHSPSCLFVTGKFNADCWVQDVATRVFATLGQPNWLAAYIVALTPLAWGKIIDSPDSKKHLKKITLGLCLFLIFFTALLFTKSRSGLLALAISFATFFATTLLVGAKRAKEKIKTAMYAVPIFLAVLSMTLIFGTPWSPSVQELLANQKQTSTPQTVSQGLALDTGGTESGEIRKIVWEGAVKVWRQNPIFGSGVETFAFSYWQQRPIAHNLTSEWDFIYNKAHNEYLNYLATTGSVGFLAYAALIIFSLVQMIKMAPFKKESDQKILVWGLVSGYLGILVTNFFGFSVVLVSLLFFLFPAMTVADADEDHPQPHQSLLTKTLLIVILLAAGYLIIQTGRYWYADYLYAQARTQGQRSDYNQKITLLTKAVAISPGEAIYRSELAQTYSTVAALLSQNQKELDAATFQNTLTKVQNLAIESAQVAQDLSPHNPNILRGVANVYADLSLIQANYILESITTLEKLASLAPTDPSVYYRLGLAYYRAGNKERTIENLKKAINLKPNYKTARQKLATIYKLAEQIDLAQIELKYILEKIDPLDQTARDLLDEISGQN